MDIKTQARYEARALVLKAMAHPTRLYLVDILSKNETCVQELTDKIGADMSTVSRHLGVLKSAGIIEGNKRGAQVYYKLRVPCVLNFFACVETVIKATASEQLKLAR